MTEEQKRKPENTKTWKNGEIKSTEHQGAVCL